jgi:hypothetical protein
MFDEFYLDEDGESDESEDDREDGVDEAVAGEAEVEVAADAEAAVLRLCGKSVCGWKK